MSILADRYATALVTGASTGLGRAFSDMLLAEGVRVWGTARDPARLPARPGFTPLALELADAATIDRAFQAATAAAGRLDLVINNAGYGLFGAFAEQAFADWQRQVDAMLGQTMHLAQLALRGMRERNRGALVNVSSLAVDFPLPFMSGYNITKAGLSALSESLMIEVSGTGIIVIDFRPGDYRTGFNQAMHRTSGTRAAAGSPSGPRLQRVWSSLEAHLRSAPPPERAAGDLRRALIRGRSGTVRSGTFFQAQLAPWLARFAPPGLRRAVMARYFGSY
ncbi:MAG: SDR family NAD(P)-dependent oxidoreductase [Opitutaceae bacterium]|nr:SDR family NAD(P)-dependent oxidoreductase [Opitutaceae bacterium]